METEDRRGTRDRARERELWENVGEAKKSGRGGNERENA